MAGSIPFARESWVVVNLYAMRLHSVRCKAGFEILEAT